ncbi:MAG: HAMP domain-containing sensor histidine kinase, partial [Calditrichota bacterium]
STDGIEININKERGRISVNSLADQLKRKYAYDFMEENEDYSSNRKDSNSGRELTRFTLSVILDNLMGHVKNKVEEQREFFAEAVHQIKSPLAILRANWEEELNNPKLPENFRGKLAQNIETITRMSQLINKMLLLSQTEISGSNLTFLPVRLDDLLAEIVEETRILAESKDQKIIIKNLPETKVNGDRDRLYQLYFNIIDNAIKYTPEKGKITISGKVENNIAIIDIKDTGPGIPVEELSLIFKRFYRVRNDNTNKISGNGLGLSICKLISELHRGTINVISDSEKGSTFRILLPTLQE